MSHLMHELVSDLPYDVAILIAAGLWVAFIYITAVPDRAGPGTRVWHLRDVWDWIIWKTLKR